jgi:hypothetical protein
VKADLLGQTEAQLDLLAAGSLYLVEQGRMARENLVRVLVKKFPDPSQLQCVLNFLWVVSLVYVILVLRPCRGPLCSFCLAYYFVAFLLKLEVPIVIPGLLDWKGSFERPYLVLVYQRLLRLRVLVRLSRLILSDSSWTCTLSVLVFCASSVLAQWSL